MKKFLFAFGALALLACAATPASAGNTVLFSSSRGDITFPIVAPTSNPAAPGTLDNTDVGQTTPGKGSFTALTATSQAFTGAAPVPTGTGTPTIAAGSTDNAGEVTAGTSATSVVITFAAAKTNAPFCLARSQAQVASFAYSISTTAITITQTATSANLIDYICVQH